MKHNYYHNIGRFIGYYYGVSPVLSKYPEGDAGDYFLNGETCSLWMWDAASATWIDTNRVDSGLQQMLTDEEGNSPSDYVPSPSVGIKEAYFYVAENADCDNDEAASPREITFTYFKNGNSSVSVEVRKTSIVILYWNGDYWETSVVPMNVDLSLYAKDADLQAEKVRATAAEQQLKDGKADKVTDAANGNLAAFDSSGNLSDSSITAAKVETFISTMPTATAENEGKIYLYTGTSDSGGTFYPGNKYVCRPYDGGYRWESLNGYVIAPEGISGGGGTSLPDGTVMYPLKTKTIGGVQYKEGTPLIVQNGGWFPWRADSTKIITCFDMPTASKENEGMTYYYIGGNETDSIYSGNEYLCQRIGDTFKWISPSGYIIAKNGIKGGGGTSLPDGTIVVPLKTTTIGSVTYYAGTPLIVQNGGWYPWRGDTAKVAVIWDLPVASSENEGMTYLSLNFNDTPNPRGFYTSYKSSDGQYSWRKVGLLSEENFTTAEKEKIASLDSMLEGQKGDLEKQISDEISRATAAEQANAEAILVEQNRATAAEQANADSIAAEVADRIAAIAALNPQLLRGTLYLSSDSTRIYKDALMTQEYDLKEADGAGVWLVRGSMIVGFLIQGWFQATIYPHNADYMLHWKWNAEFSRWEWEDTPKTYAVTPEEKEKWNDAVSRLNDFLTSVDATDTAINKWKELENFLAGITDTDTLTGLLYEQETRLNDAIGEETARATKAENDLQASVTANTRSIETEVSRAKAVEQQLKDGKADKVTDAANGNLAAFDSSGNLSDSSITAAKVETFISTMPTATAENEGKIYLYTGTSDSGGTFYPGNKYVCRPYDGGYRWESLNGYVIAPEGISGGGGTSLPDGTVMYPLKTKTIGGVQYKEGTPLIVQNGGWFPWRADSTKIITCFDMPTASKENEGMTYYYIGGNETDSIYSGNEYLCQRIGDTFKWISPSGYIIAKNGIKGGGGTSLPDGTIVVPLKTTTIGSVTYYAGTPLIVQNGGWYPWRGDTAKVAVIWDLPVASSENEGMTYLSLNFNDTPNPRGFYTSYKSSDGQYSWRKVGLLSEENFTTAEKEKIASLDSMLEGQKGDLEKQISDEISRATAAEQANAEAISAETSRATAAEQTNAEAIETEASRAEAAEEVLRSSINAVSSSIPSISDMDISEIDSLGNTSVSGTYIINDGSKRGILLFENTGNNAQRQTLYMENTLKYRTRDAAGWSEWKVLADLSDGLAAVATSGSYNDLNNLPSLSSVATSGNYESLSNKPLQGSISFDAADSLCQSYQNGVYIVTDGGLTQGLLSFATAGNGGLMQYLLQDGTIKSRSGSYMGGSSPSWNGWQTVDFGVSDYNDLSNKPVKFSEEITDLNGYTNEGIFFVKGTNDKATNLPITNTGETINVAFTLLVSVSKPITMDDGRLRAIVGQQLTLANRIGSENKQYLRHAIVDTINGETTYTWGVWREAVTQTMLGNGGICTDADIDAAIDNGIYSGVASESGILPQYSTFTMVVVNNYAATAAASVMGVPSDWRQVTQTFIALPLSTSGEITEGATYMRTGIGGSTITWGELKQVGGEKNKIFFIKPGNNAIDFTQDFEVISFAEVSGTCYWSISNVPTDKTQRIKREIWLGKELSIPIYDLYSDTVTIDNVQYTVSGKIRYMAGLNIQEGAASHTLQPEWKEIGFPAESIPTGGISTFELYIDIDVEAHTIELILIPKY